MEAVTRILTEIRNQRMAKSYSQEYMAYKLACSQNAYSKIELGHTKITLIQLFKIAGVLDISLHDLLPLSRMTG